MYPILTSLALQQVLDCSIVIGMEPEEGKILDEKILRFSKI